MMSGVMTNTKNPNLSICPKPATFQSFFENTHSMKSPSFLASPVFSPNSHLQSPKSTRGFRTQASVIDEVVVSDRETTLSFYELLGIPESGSFDEIKQAYKQLARKYHPDVSPPDRTKEYTKKFIEVQEAYETLSDPSTRALYDRDMSRGLHLAFSARKGHGEGLGRDEWRNQWQAQVTNLKHKGAGRNMSWAAQMRKRRSESDGSD